MSKPQDLLSTQEFAKKAGVSAATVSKWLRNGTISGIKKGGKWAVAASELVKVSSPGNPAPPAQKVATQPDPVPQEKKAKNKSFSIQEFSEMTYLTEFGVRQWLKEGRLDNTADKQGNVRVDAANLDKPDVKRLVR